MIAQSNNFLMSKIIWYSYPHTTISKSVLVNTIFIFIMLKYILGSAHCANTLQSTNVDFIYVLIKMKQKSTTLIFMHYFYSWLIQAIKVLTYTSFTLTKNSVRSIIAFMLSWLIKMITQNYMCLMCIFPIGWG